MFYCFWKEIYWATATNPSLWDLRSLRRALKSKRLETNCLSPTPALSLAFSFSLSAYFYFTEDGEKESRHSHGFLCETDFLQTFQNLWEAQQQQQLKRGKTSTLFFSSPPPWFKLGPGVCSIGKDLQPVFLPSSLCRTLFTILSSAATQWVWEFDGSQ